MDRVSDNAIEIINELHTERLNYESEYLPLIDCANKCSAYEDTGLEPEEIERIRSDVESGYLKSTARRYGIDINVCVHALVDDLKANRKKINLWHDQIIHMWQIAVTAIVML